jgi:hypothetical protein
LKLDDGLVTKFLFLTQGVGVVFVAIFLAAYLAGLPTTAVLHSDPIVRTSLAVIGVVFLLLILSNVILAALVRKNKSV